MVQPMAPKIAAISSMVRLIGWIRPVSRGRGRQRGIEAFGSQAGIEFGVFQRGAAGFDQSGERVLELVQRGTALAALFGRGLAEVAEQGGEASVAAERGDAHRVPGAQIGDGGQGGLGFALQVGEIVGHGGTLHVPPIPSWPGLSRPSTSYVRPKDVGGRAKPGHGR